MELPRSHPEQTSTTTPSSELSKNKLRKLRAHEQKQAHRKTLQRPRERLARKQRGQSNGLGNDEKLALKEKLQKALQDGPKLVIDCQYQNLMSLKEKTRFAQQIRRLYSANRNSENPLHIYLTSLSRESELYSVCCKQNFGFDNYLIDIREQHVSDVVYGGSEQLVYLSPDADQVIDIEKGFELDKVYVIGGLVDETTNKNQSAGVAKSLGVQCVRLPIDEFFECGDGGTGKRVLTVNQVVDIVLEWHRTKDWVAALSAGLPQRTGFKVKQQHDHVQVEQQQQS